MVHCPLFSPELTQETEMRIAMAVVLTATALFAVFRTIFHKDRPKLSPEEAQSIFEDSEEKFQEPVRA
jgi:hypothetical protein